MKSFRLWLSCALLMGCLNESRISRFNAKQKAESGNASSSPEAKVSNDAGQSQVNADANPAPAPSGDPGLGKRPENQKPSQLNWDGKTTLGSNKMAIIPLE